MLDLEELFKKHPGIYQINKVYYAFGAGVCAKCDERYVTLPVKYQNYVDSKDNDMLTRDKAMRLYNSKSYEPSYVLTAMGIPVEKIENSVRVSWGSESDVEDVVTSFKELLMVARGLVF